MINKTTKTKRSKELGIKILQAIKDFSQLIPRPLESKSQHQRRLWSMIRGYPSQRVSLGVYRLLQQGLITTSVNSGKYFKYRLTIDGYQKILLSKINRSKTPVSDNKATIIIFDIPEAKAKHRGFLRRLLLKNGFTSLQKSVFVSRYELPDEFFELLRGLGIKQNVTLIKGTVIYR